MKVRATGTLGLIAQPTEFDFDPVRGVVMHYRYKAVGIDNTAAWLGFLMNERLACRARLGGAVSELEITYSGGRNGFNDVGQTNWEVLGNEIQKSISESGIALSGEAAFPGTLVLLRGIVSSIDSGELDFSSAADIRGAAEDQLGISIPDGQWTYLGTLIGFILRGQTHFAQGQYVAKLTTSVSNFFNGSSFIGTSEALWSTGALLGIGGMPNAISAIINNVTPGTSHTGYTWSWRQLPPRAVTGAYNRVEISVEWWFEEWSTDLYPNTVGF